MFRITIESLSSPSSSCSHILVNTMKGIAFLESSKLESSYLTILALAFHKEMVVFPFFLGLNFCPALWASHLGLKGTKSSLWV